MQINKSIQKLDIPDNDIGIGGAVAISEINSCLVYLNLARNKISSMGVDKISKSLQVNSTLQKLNILCNNLSYGGALALSECLKVCRGLIELDISGSSITCEGLQLILEATQTNTVLSCQITTYHLEH